MDEVLRERALAGEFRLRLMRGDLARVKVDAVVNAANEELRHGGGLAAALLKAGGDAIRRESEEWVRLRGRVPTGGAAITSGGDLPASFVIHAVGPVWRGGGEGEDDLLRGAVHEALLMARARRLGSVALPAISAGIFGFPKDRCARLMLDEVARFADVHQVGGPEDIRIVLRDEDVVEAFVGQWDGRSGRTAEP